MKRKAAAVQEAADQAFQKLSLRFCGLIVAATAVAFYPILKAGFVNWDDDVNILENAHLGLSWSQLKWMFTTCFMGPYQPLSWLSLAIDHRFWGIQPFGYHLTSLLLHCANAAAFFLLSLRLLQNARPRSADEKPWVLPASAALAAFLFAVHPLRAESVAWATERRDVLSGLFYLLTLCCYLPDGNGRRRLGLSAFFFALSLLAKGLGMTLPAILLILDVYPLRRNLKDRGVWLEKMPFALLAAAAAAIGYFGQKQAGVIHSLDDYGVMDRVCTVFYNLSFYLEKTFWPGRLIVLYEAPKPVQLWTATYGFRALGVLVTVGVLAAAARRWPAGLAAWLCYAAALLPVVGVVKYGQQISADRYSYLSCLSWAALAGGLLREGLLGSRVLRTAAGTAALAACAALTPLTLRQLQVWRNSETLWNQFLSAVPDHVFANNNLGNYLADQGRYEEAARRYQIALSVDPGSAYAQYNLGNALVRMNRPEEAVAHYQAALRAKPDYEQAKHNLALIQGQAANVEGIRLAQQGRLDEAIVRFQAAIAVDPKNVAPYNNLGASLADKGRLAEAERIFKTALQIDPRSAEVHNSWAIALYKNHRSREAAGHYQQALALKPDLPGARNNLGVLLADQGQYAAAAEQYRLALQADPNYADAHFNLGNALAALGKAAEAASEYKETLRLRPDHALARRNLAQLSGGRP